MVCNLISTITKKLAEFARGWFSLSFEISNFPDGCKVIQPCKSHSRTKELTMVNT